MNETSVSSVLGAPDAETGWLDCVLEALQRLRPAYHTDPRGIVRLGRVVARFQWDRLNGQFYANLTDAQLSFGGVVGGVISGIDPQKQSIDEAADHIHAQFARFANRLRSRDSR